MKKSKKCEFQHCNSGHGGAPAPPATSRRRQWDQSTQEALAMPMVIGTQAAVAGDGRKQPMALSDPSKMGLKPDMDHTR